jgi:hypothetical protein
MFLYTFSRFEYETDGIAGFLDFVNLSVFRKLENITFRKLDLVFPSSSGGEADAYSVGSLRKS